MTGAAGKRSPPPERLLIMIALHRITNPDHPLYLNPDLFQTIEANPDTVITLENSSKFVVRETPAEIVQLVREWRASVIATAGDVPAVVARLHPIRG
jgi:flagellar protein FlbD